MQADLGLCCLLTQSMDTVVCILTNRDCPDQTDAHAHLGPVVQSIVSLTSSLRVISLTVLADSIYNILILFAEKM